MRSLHRSLDRRLACGFLPAASVIPARTRARSLDTGRSPGSRVVACAPPSRLAAMASRGAGSPRTVAGAAALSGFTLSRFSPCGPPASDGRLACRRENAMLQRIEFTPDAPVPLSGIRVVDPVAPGRRQHGQPATRRSGRRGHQDRGPEGRRSAARLALEGPEPALEGLCAQQEEPGAEPAPAGRTRRVARPAGDVAGADRELPARHAGSRWGSARTCCTRAIRS